MERELLSRRHTIFSSSSPKRRVSACLQPAITVSAWFSCRRNEANEPSVKKSLQLLLLKKAKPFSVGERCRPITPLLAQLHGHPSRSCDKYLSGGIKNWRTIWPSSGN